MEADKVTIDRTTNQSNSTAAEKAQQDPLGRDAFMSLLLTQLQHQDPTQPQADGEFLAQLAQFSALEQLQQMNKKLESMSAFFTQIESAQGTAPTEAK
jgi:flagellar basal-body rod modification protein FlgD